MPKIPGVGHDYFLPEKKVEPPKGLADSDAFLKILIAQLKYQDPMEPQDSATFISQLSQMASMEQMLNMGQNMKTMAEKYDMARYFDVIGEHVSLIEGNELIQGIVAGVVFDDQVPYFYLDQDPKQNLYTMDQVVTIHGKNSGGLLPYLNLMGHHVKVKGEKDQTEITGVVEKVLWHNGRAAVQVGGVVYGADQILEVSSHAIDDGKEIGEPTNPPAEPEDPPPPPEQPPLEESE